MNTTLRSGTPEEAGMFPERLQVAKNTSKKWVDQGILPALVILVARHGVIVLHEAFGKVKRIPESPPTELDTIFMMTSLSKPVTGAALMCLVEDGLVGLNTPVADYIPEFSGENKDKVMVNHLMTHTSGMTEDIYKYHESKKGTVEVPPAESTQHPTFNKSLFTMYDAPLNISPGEMMSYCDYNFDLIGEIIRRVSGKSLDAFVRERIFGPLEMKDSYYETPDSVKPRVAQRIVEVVREGTDEKVTEYPSGGWGLISSAMDMASFTQMFLNKGMYGDKRVLSPASAHEMTRNQLPGVKAKFKDEILSEANWGLGWGVYGTKDWFTCGDLPSSESFWHGGWGTCYLWADPVCDIVGAFFSVTTRSKMSYRESGLFTNMITAAVMDV